MRRGSGSSCGSGSGGGRSSDRDSASEEIKLMPIILISLTHVTHPISSSPTLSHPIPSYPPHPSGLWSLAAGAVAGGDAKGAKKGAVVAAAGGTTVTLTPGRYELCDAAGQG